MKVNYFHINMLFKIKIIIILDTNIDGLSKKFVEILNLDSKDL